MEEQNIRIFSVSIHNIGVCLYVLEPLEILKQEATGIHVDSSILDEQDQPELITDHPIYRRTPHHLSLILLINVLMQISITQLPNLPSTPIKYVSHIFQTQLHGQWGLFKPWVPKYPEYFWDLRRAFDGTVLEDAEQKEE